MPPHGPRRIFGQLSGGLYRLVRPVRPVKNLLGGFKKQTTHRSHRSPPFPNSRARVAIRSVWSGGLIICTCAVAAACGPAKPMLLYAPPSVTIDSARGPTRAPIAFRSKTFWDAMASLDTGFIARHPASESERAFAHALGLVMSGEVNEA